MPNDETGLRLIDSISDLVSNCCDEPSTETQIPDCQTLRSVQREVLAWFNLCGFGNNPIYAETAALEPFPKKWIGGVDSEKREIHRRRQFLEDLARNVGIAIRLPKPIRSRLSLKRESPRKLSDRDKILLRIAARDVEGLEYCRIVDLEGVQIRPLWIKRGCPSTYTAAYKSGKKWQQRINHEKWQVSGKARGATSLSVLSEQE